MKPTGKLLSRNEGSATAPHPLTIDSNGHIDGSMYDPSSENFVVPPGMGSTPRDLAIFFTQELRKHSDPIGKRWRSLLDHRAYLRPAKVLLEEFGFEGAVRSIVLAVRVAKHCPSFAFVLRVARKRFGK